MKDRVLGIDAHKSGQVVVKIEISRMHSREAHIFRIEKLSELEPKFKNTLVKPKLNPTIAGMDRLIGLLTKARKIDRE